MRRFGSLAFALLSASSVLATGSLLARSPPGGSYGSPGTGTGNTGDTGGGGGTNGTSANVRGDSACGSSMCVAAQVNGDTVRYTLTSQRPAVGWMAMGFGRQMVRTPMVIMWANEDGSITLSQRQATSQTEPDVVATPPRVATLQSSLSVASGSNQQYVFDIPANSDTTQDIIYAFSSSRPTSSAPDATLFQHIDEGRLSLDLTRVSGGSGEDNDDDDGESIPLSSTQRVLLAHAIIATIGFLLVLPFGALIPRYLRTFTPGWFKFHWILQLVFGGLTVVIGVVLGIVGVSNSGGTHVNSTHKRLGIVLLALYVIQVSLGAIIHFFKPKSRRRPPQNYIHALLGIAIIALALYQVRTGYRIEWPESTGNDVPNGVNILWYVWVALLPVAYGLGLAFLPKQFRQEKKSRQDYPQ